MAALVQTYPQQVQTVTMIQARPGSSSGAFSQNGQGQQRGSQVPRNVYSGGQPINSYRGQTPTTPYAFTAAPSMADSNPLRQHPTTPHLRQENRTSSAPALQTTNQNRQSSGPFTPGQLPKEDFPGLQKTVVESSDRPSSMLDLSIIDPRLASGNTAKPAPDRYRKNLKRSESSQPALGSSGAAAVPSGSGMAAVGHLYQHTGQSLSSSSFTQSNDARAVSKDDSAIGNKPEQAKRYKRRSIQSIAGDVNAMQAKPKAQTQPAPRSYASVVSGQQIHAAQSDPRPFAAAAANRPGSSHGRNGSDDSNVSSSHSSSRPSSKREAGGMVGAANPTGSNVLPNSKHDSKSVSVPPRGSSDANKRLANPSPLSRPMAVGQESPVSKNSFASLVAGKTSPNEQPNASAPAAKVPESPAAQHLAALNNKDGKKDGKHSRLRRAFSFGSAAELRKASAENAHVNNERAKLRKDQFRDEEEARQAAIAARQEAGGLGEGIYSGQGNFFTGSTDNLSVSSTASSASVMLRKMGKGMKKSTRSLVGLFRPKSVIGVPAADAAVPEPSVAQVSMVTVEAEREKVNVNANPHDQAGGGTGFPKLERNSLDAATLSQGEPSLTSDKSSDAGRSRQSIVGGERERAEVLATLKKGILKRHGTGSNNSSPHQRPTPDFALPQVPRFGDSPHSSQPSTPVDEHTPRGHRRTDSVTIEGEDYFMSSNKLGGTMDSRSLPGTPRSIAAVAAKNISFSPRIQFHDTWPSGEYDRRGEIATCNRLTPTLAQAIKEELNTFKMEMEVHETSKVYTHFF